MLVNSNWTVRQILHNISDNLIFNKKDNSSRIIHEFELNIRYQWKRLLYIQLRRITYKYGFRKTQKEGIWKNGCCFQKNLPFNYMQNCPKCSQPWTGRLLIWSPDSSIWNTWFKLWIIIIIRLILLMWSPIQWHIMIQYRKRSSTLSREKSAGNSQWSNWVSTCT